MTAPRRSLSRSTGNAAARYVLAVVGDFGRDLPRLFEALADSRTGWPTVASHARTGRRSGVSDPTANRALEGDPAARDLDRLSIAVTALVDWAREVDAIRCNWTAATRIGLCDNAGRGGCPDRAPRAEGRKRCDACAQHLHRYGRERGT